MTDAEVGRFDQDDLQTSRWRRTAAQRRANLRARWRRARITNTIAYIQNGGVVEGDAVNLYLQLRTDPRLEGTKHVWLVKSEARARALRAAWGDHSATTYVVAQTDDAIKQLCRTKTIVTDDTLPQNFSKRAGQSVIHTATGPLARARYADSLRAPADLYRLRALLVADVVLVPDAGARQTLEERWQLRPISTARLVEAGAIPLARPPLTSSDLRLETDPSTTQPLVVVALGNERGGSPRLAASELATRLARELGARAVIATVDLPFASHEGEHFPVHARPGKPTDAALAVARVVVTDDPHFRRRAAAQTVIPAAAVSAELIWRALESPQRAEVPDNDKSSPIATVASSLHLRDDGSASPTASAADKPRILLHLGAMKRNGITTAALNLLRTLDYETLDVTAHVAVAHTPDQVEAIAQIDPRARVLLTPPGRAVSFERLPLKHWTARVLPIGRHPSLVAVRRALQPEWSRIFGGSRFDVVADFSGYSPWYAGLMLAGDAKHRTIWMHSDMVAEATKTVDGRQPHRSNLRQTFSIYRHYDVVAAVSEAIATISRDWVASVAPESVLAVVPNALARPNENELRVATAAEIDALASIAEPWVANARAFLTRRSEAPRILAVGRLSPEKNYSRLLHALSHESLGTTSLVILGDGPLRAELERTARDLGIADRVAFPGHRPSALPYLQRADCLAVSSDHEGLPMAILEARMLGVPVVATNFGSAHEAVPPDAGIVVDRSAAALAAGLHDVLSGPSKVATLDAAEHNAASVIATLRALGLTAADES